MLLFTLLISGQTAEGFSNSPLSTKYHYIHVRVEDAVVPASFAPSDMQSTFDKKQSCFYILSLKLLYNCTNLAHSMCIGPPLSMKQKFGD